MKQRLALIELSNQMDDRSPYCKDLVTALTDFAEGAVISDIDDFITHFKRLFPGA